MIESLAHFLMNLMSFWAWWSIGSIKAPTLPSFGLMCCTEHPLCNRAQASASIVETAAPAVEPVAAATSVVDSNAAAPSLDLAQVGSTAALMEAAVSSVGDAAAAGASVVDSSLKDRRQSNAEVSTEVGLTAFH